MPSRVTAPASRFSSFLCSRSLRARRGIDARRRVLGDVGVHQIELAAALGGVSLVDADAALAQRLDLAAGENQPGLDRVLDEVIVPGLAVLRDVAVGRTRHALSSARQHDASRSGLSPASPPWVPPAEAGPRRSICR